ncbi:DUF3576 domain-containing protein [Pseudooceanicola onchidii]|uniref:DUF3576 domain-containing protein n=1 Tax=Pseudooceanicola onchidii TaxID=2562279 RepID=UPI001F0DE501|nr:DUF3576 domain-containing protein [Pseudooceanicola onchidii]
MTKFALIAVLAVSVAACSRNRVATPTPDAPSSNGVFYENSDTNPGTTIWEALRKETDDGSRVAVNRYLWNASLEVLDFLPVQSVDPFSGVIVTGYGTPPGGGRAYRATIYVKDPALDARSLNVSIMTRGGPVAEGTQRAVEDAILTRARQLRVADKRL